MPVSMRNFYHKLAGDLFKKEETKNGGNNPSDNAVLKPAISSNNKGSK